VKKLNKNGGERERREKHKVRRNMEGRGVEELR
jgi:hypothetical protein